MIFSILATSPQSNFTYFFAFLGPHPVAYGGSQARGQIRAVATGLRHSQQPRQIWATSATYTTTHGNAGSLTHWARPGIEPTSSWILVRFVTAEPQQKLQNSGILDLDCYASGSNFSLHFKKTKLGNCSLLWMYLMQERLCSLHTADSFSKKSL